MLMEMNSDGHGSNMQLSDGQDLVNFVMGMQDKNFNERKAELQSEKNWKKFPEKKFIIEEDLSNESS